MLGKDCKIYHCLTALNDSTNTPVLATWIERKNVKDVTLNLSKEEADTTTREGNGWKQTAGTLKDGSVEYEMLWAAGDPLFDALQAAWANDTEVAMFIADGDESTPGTQGLAANFSVTNFTRNEPLAEAVTASVTLKPGSYPSWYEVPAASDLISVAEYTVTMAAGAATIDLTACGEAADKDLSGLRVTYLKIEGVGTNANAVTVETGSANGYTLDNDIVVEAGDVVYFTKAVANQIDVDATHKILDVSGTLVEGIKVTIVAEAAA